MKKLRVLFATVSTFFSHTMRPLCIAECLGRRGHEIAFLASKGNQTLIEDAGFKTFPVHELPHEIIITCGALPDYVQRFRAAFPGRQKPGTLGIDRMAEEDLSAYSACRPDIIVNDGRETVQETALIAGIPYIRIENLMALNPACEPELSNYVESEICEEKKNLMERVAVILADSSVPAPLTGRILPGLIQFDTFNGENYHHFIPHTIVGPLNWEGWSRKAKPVKEMYKGKKVILVTIGSSYPFPHIVHCVVEKFGGKEGYHVIVNTGGQIEQLEFDYPNVELIPYLSLGDFLEICDAVVYHGGHGTTLQLLKAGVPAVAVPFNGSQMLVSRQLDRLKTGIRIKKYPDDISSQELYDAIREVIDNPVYRENIVPFQNWLNQSTNGEEEASDFIEEFAQKAYLRKVSASFAALKKG